MKHYVMAFTLLLSIIALSINAKAEYILCNTQTIVNEGQTYQVPSLSVDTPQRTIFLQDALNLGQNDFYSNVISSGEYKADDSNSTDQKLIFDVSSSLDYPCNYQAGFMVFNLNSDHLDIVIQCDGASAFPVLSLKLDCTHY
jgi:hypothetical protein